MVYETPRSIDISITYGHDDTHVVVQFSQMIQNNRMDEKQTMDMIKALKDALGKLRAQNKKKTGPLFQS